MCILPQFLNKVICEPSGPTFPGEHFPYPRELDSHFHSFWRTQCLQGTPLNTPLREPGEQGKPLVLTIHHCPWNSRPLWASLKPPPSSTSFDPSSASTPLSSELLTMSPIFTNSYFSPPTQPSMPDNLLPPTSPP